MCTMKHSLWQQNAKKQSKGFSISSNSITLNLNQSMYFINLQIRSTDWHTLFIYSLLASYKCRRISMPGRPTLVVHLAHTKNSKHTITNSDLRLAHQQHITATQSINKMRRPPIIVAEYTYWIWSFGWMDVTDGFGSLYVIWESMDMQLNGSEEVEKMRLGSKASCNG